MLVIVHLVHFSQKTLFIDKSTPSSHQIERVHPVMSSSQGKKFFDRAPTRYSSFATNFSHDVPRTMLET